MLNSMKRLSGLLIVGTVLFSACKSSNTSPTDSISLGLHQSGRLGSEIVVRVDSIQDSRCPLNVTCIWAGQAKVKFLLSKDTDSTAVRLSLGADPGSSNKRPDSTTVSLNSERYKVILREVNPYPGSTTTNQPQTTVVQVTKF
ncbi:hypothetical protein CWM47_29990 [Spirosoma pollinicola]|uniref:Lipoprotein n=2 Tax=Spirosoma pollinicola TaxID=2057025 RepID=A0A2K8Z755_9BACT|nr:hypothetical protein CWM47_29990 [Spirosoma pollinicola]